MPARRKSAALVKSHKVALAGPLSVGVCPLASAQGASAPTLRYDTAAKAVPQQLVGAPRPEVWRHGQGSGTHR